MVNIIKKIFGSYRITHCTHGYRIYLREWNRFLEWERGLWTWYGVRVDTGYAEHPKNFDKPVTYADKRHYDRWYVQELSQAKDVIEKHRGHVLNEFLKTERTIGYFD